MIPQPRFESHPEDTQIEDNGSREVPVTSTNNAVFGKERVRSIRELSDTELINFEKAHAWHEKAGWRNGEVDRAQLSSIREEMKRRRLTGNN